MQCNAPSEQMQGNVEANQNYDQSIERNNEESSFISTERDLPWLWLGMENRKQK